MFEFVSVIVLTFLVAMVPCAVTAMFVEGSVGNLEGSHAWELSANSSKPLDTMACVAGYGVVICY